MVHRKKMGKSIGSTGASSFSLDMLRKAASGAVVENAGELVDAEFMVQRLRDGKEISCTFVTYDRNITCTVSGRKYSLQEMCTCEAGYFCRHAAALVLTFIERPDSFLSLESFLDELAGRPREELVGMLRRMIGRYPASSLEILGEPGFQPSEIIEELDEDVFPFGDGGLAEDLLDHDFDSEEDEDDIEFDDDDDFDGPGRSGGLN
jgi:hypothetical protein